MTTKIVADDVLGVFARQQHDWFERVRKGSLNPEEITRAVQAVIDRGTVFTRDMRKESWKLLEDAPRRITSVKDIELVPFLKKNEKSIKGEELVLRARGELNADYGQHDAEYLLEHQDEIPAEFRKYYLVFTKTIWRDSDGRRRVPYLGFDGGHWYLRFLWLEDDYSSHVRLVRPRE